MTGEPSEEGVGERPLRLCVVPAELAPKLLDPLRRHFAGDPTVEVITERRVSQRRSGEDRRKEDAGPPKGTEDRRRIKNAPDNGGRRVGERRAALVPVDPPPDLPRKARPYADQISL